jgi:hypothetical protein
MFEGAFHCPANPERYGAFPTPAGWPIIAASSYLTINYLMMGGTGAYDMPPGGIPAAAKSRIATGHGPDPYGTPGPPGSPRTYDIEAPAGYMPRHSRLARESGKVFLADGLRFYDQATNSFDYDVGVTSIYSSFTASSPPAVGGSNAREYGASRQFSYRHRGGRAIELAFFDGHVEQMFVDFRGLDEKGIGYSGTAVDPRWYFPTGSTICNADVLHKQGVQNGLTLP